MLKLRTSGLAALSFAMSAALAQGAGSGAAGDGPCRGDCGSRAAQGHPAWVVGPGPQLQDTLDGALLLSAPEPGSAPLLHPTSFSALAGPLQYLPFDGLAGPHDHLVPAFTEMHWNDSGFPVKKGIGPGAPVTGPTAAPRPVPEPNVYALLLAGLAAGAWASRRRKR